MADSYISQITLPSGDTYYIKDSGARAAINGIFTIAWAGNAAPVVANIPKDVVVKYNSTNYTGTKVASADTLGQFFLVKAADQGTNQEALDVYDEYVTVRSGTSPNYTYSWEKIGDTQIKLTSMVTDVSLNKQTSKVIGSSSTFSVTQPAFSVAPATIYVKTSPTKEAVLKKVDATQKKLTTTSIYGVKTGTNSTTTASKATAATSQTTATGSGTWNNTTNTTWLKGCTVNNEVLTIGAATMGTQTTTQFTFNDVTVPIRADNATTVATGGLSAESATNNVGDTLVSGITSSGTGYTIQAVTAVDLATDTTSGDGKVQVGSTGNATVTRTTNAGVAWNSKDEQTVLNNSTSLNISRPN